MIPPLGSSALNPASSCQAIVDAKTSTGNGKYFLSIGGSPLYVFCNMSTNPATNLGGDGSTIALASTSCAALKIGWLITAKGQYFIFISNSTAVKHICDNGVDFGGDGSDSVRLSKNS